MMPENTSTYNDDLLKAVKKNEGELKDIRQILQSFLSNPKNYQMDRDQKAFLKNETFYGYELVATTFKLCLMK